jgi:hypothetical protein
MLLKESGSPGGRQLALNLTLHLTLNYRCTGVEDRDSFCTEMI